MKELDLEGEWHWGFDDGGYPLIAEYDPEGWDARWAKEDAESAECERQQNAEQDEGADSGFPLDHLRQCRIGLKGRPPPNPLPCGKPRLQAKAISRFYHVYPNLAIAIFAMNGREIGVALFIACVTDSCSS